MSLSDQDRKAYESYILASTDEERQEAIKKLIPGSQLYYHLYFIDRFKKVGSNFTVEDRKIFEQFRQKYYNHQEYNEINTRLLLKKYDDAQTDEERKSALEQININLLSIPFNHYKPEDIHRMGIDSQSSQGGDSDVGEGNDPFNQFGQKKTSKFVYDDYFSKDKIQSQFYGDLANEHTSLNNLRRMPAGYEHEIDFKTYHPRAVYSIACESGCSQMISDLQNPTFYESLTKYFEEAYRLDRHFQLQQQFCNALTLSQMDKIATLHPNIKDDKTFIGSYFQKHFNEELSSENQEVWSSEEKRANLLTLYNYTKSKNMPQSLQSSLLIEILNLGIKIGVYDEDLFKEYLKIPMVLSYNVFKQQPQQPQNVFGSSHPANNKRSNADSHWNQYIGSVQSQQNRSSQWDSSQNEVINKYLEHICQQKGSLEDYKEEFNATFLKGIEEKIQIYNSDDMTNLTVDLKKYQSISQEVILRFLEQNQERFKVNEEVTLSLELKNIQTLYVKIFEFNTETYYKKTLQPFNTGVNLDGLIASIEKTYDYKLPSNKKFTESFKFPELNDKVGLFIVEFIGNGMSSRAVIKKGSLSMIHKPTIAGHLAYILDENKKIATGSKTGIYFDGQYFEAQADKGGKIFIPYGKTNLVSKAILMNNGFAQLCDFERLTENYSFQAWIHINDESILIGNKAQLIIKPSLQINSRLASPEILKNTKITLVTRNYIDNIPVTKTFENIKFKSNKELVIDFQVPPYLSNIAVTLETEVFNITQQINQKFTSAKTFNIKSYNNNKNMNEIFLRKENGNYNVYVLGKNGEAKSRVNVQVTFIHSQLKEQGMKSVTFVTDKEGRVELGHLKKIVGLEINVSLFGLHSTYMIWAQKQNLTYPSFVDAVEKEPIEFPVLFKKKSRKTISLIRKNGEIVLDDLFDQIEFIQQQDKDYNLIRLSNLSDGTYILNLKTLAKSIQITVNKGQYWETDSFILKRNCLFENRAPLKMVKISKLNVEENKDGQGSTVSVKLEDYSKEARVHVYASQFLPNLPSQTFFGLNNQMSGNNSKTVFPFAMWKNIYLSNRELSDEFRYVFDRKYAERQLGNLLERPRLVLKRAFIAQTQINQEALRQGQQYQQQSLPYESQQQQIQQQQVQYRAQPIMSNKCSPSYDMMSRSAGYPGGRGEMISYDLMNELATQDTGKMQILEFQNFLKNPPLTQFNLVPNQNGEVTFSADLSPFTQLFVLVIDYNSVAQKQVDLNVNPVQKRDLSLIQSLDVSKGFTESRQTIDLLKHDSHFIEDITSTEIQLIDDLKKVKGVLEELMKQKGTHHSGVFKELNDSLLKWPRLDIEKKNKEYYKNLCHEFNIFLYFKDKEYFQLVVKPFLQCKMEKTFIDYYLLEAYQAIQHYKHLENIERLNALEKCFLVDALMKLGQTKEAEQIAEYIALQSEASHYEDISTYNRIFDIVLNLNMLKVADIAADPFADLLGGSHHMNMPPPPGAPSGSLFGAPPTAGNYFGAHPQPSAAMGFGASAAPFQMYANQNQAFGDFDDFGGFSNNNANISLSNVQPMMQQQQQQQQAYYQRPQPRAMNRNVQPMAMMTQNIQPASYDLFGGGGGMESLDIEYDERRHIQSAYEDQKKKVRLQFEEVQSTNEYMETHYFKQTNYAVSTSLVSINGFWADYAKFLSTNTSSERQFLSANFIRNADNQTAALMTFALLDLPFEAESHGYKTNESRGVEIKAVGNIILFKKEVRDAPLALTNDIIVTHRYIASNSSGENQSAMPDEFLVNTSYSCEVIMTNVSPQSKTFSILYQIPSGSLPLEMTKYMKSIPMSLSPYTTSKQIFHFYFPNNGEFTHFPSNVSVEQNIVARANANQLKVVSKLSVAKKETFRDILIGGSKDDILEFLKTNNLIKGEKGFTFNDLLWMLKDAVFYKKVIEVLRSRYIYNDQIWSYGFYHKDDESICREYLNKQKPYNLTSYLGATFESKLFKLNFDQTEFKHLDYFPMINARVHMVGDLEQWTLNQNFKTTYDKFLRTLAELKNMSTELKMMFVYNLQLQDRISEAIQMFKTINIDDPELNGTLRIQYDYMAAYFDFFTGQDDGFKTARSIVRKYEDYPISSWRILFLEILDQLNEYDGEIDETLDIDPENLTDEQKKQKYKASIKKEPRLDCEVSSENQKISLEIANIKSFTIKFYIIDAEILFSRTPFLKENTEEFSYVKPCHVIEKELATPDLNSSIDTVTYLQASQKFDLEIPQHLKNQNMVVEINGEGIQIFKTYYSTQIKVNLVEAYGELKVTDKEGQPLSKVYVKVFAQKNGQAATNAVFFKDGYTDIRGKFEYAQTSGNKLKEVQKFAILVMSDTLGSTIKECNPPKGFTTTSAANDLYLGQDEQFKQQKAERIVNRVAHSKAAVLKKCK